MTRPAKPCDISERKGPTHVHLSCDCGWHQQINRRQNAWARAAQVREAIRRHLDEKAKANG